MKIVHIISTLNIGGAENFVVQLANSQVSQNRVTVLVLGHTDPENNYIAALHSDVAYLELGWNVKYSLRQLYQLNRQLNNIGPHAVHVHLHNPFYYVFALSFFKRKPKYIHTMHSSFGNWKRVLGIIYKLRFLNNRIVHVSLSKTITDAIKKDFPKFRTTTIANGIRPYVPSRQRGAVKRFWHGFGVPPTKGFRFLAIGNISDNKNYALLAQSFKALREQFPELMCIQVGAPSDKALTEELKQINAPNVFLAGAVSNAADLLTEADALVISSVQEGMPIVALEALSMGVPIITTPAGGMPDIVNPSIGFVSDDFEVTSFKKTLRQFMALSYYKKRELAANAKKMFRENYDITIAERQYKLHYGLE